MRKKLLCTILIALLFISMFSGCQLEQNGIEKPYDAAYYDVSQFYVQYMEFTMRDAAHAANFCYFEDETAKELYLQSAQKYPTISYEIIRFEKLSDFLWVIEVHVTDGMHPNGVYFVNYVGIIDNNMMVYRNSRKLPAALTEGLEIEDYEVHGPDIVK